MKKIALLPLLLMLLMCSVSNAQDMRFINLDASTNGTTTTGPGAGIRLFDNGGPAAPYNHGYDYYCVIQSTCEISSFCDDSSAACSHMSIQLFHYDIGDSDTLYIYDGNSPSAPLLLKVNNSFRSSQNRKFFVTKSNSSRSLCVRFRTNPVDVSHDEEHQGFELRFDCEKPCENVTGIIDDMYELLDPQGNVVSNRMMTLFPVSFDTIYDTIFQFRLHQTTDTIVTDRIKRIDTTDWARGVMLCQGQGLRLHGHGEYSNYYGYYTGRDETSLFDWDFGTGENHTGTNFTSADYMNYTEPRCYDVTLFLTDSNECPQNNFEKIQVRIAQNPIKTIFDLGSICSQDSLLVNVGYEGENSTLTLRKINYEEVTSKSFEALTFIPDGPLSGVLCYDAPVTFNEFPSGKVVESASDICSICVNYEHSYMGDYTLAITCPSYDPNVDPNHGIAYLKYKNKPAGVDLPDGTWDGGVLVTGGPWGSPDFLYGDDRNNAGDQYRNPYGIGLNYCFSHNGNYTLVNGEPCNTENPQGAGIASRGHTTQVTMAMPIPPAGYNHAGEDLGERTWTTQQPSDHDNKSDYYIPADDFSTLVGCPLNGTWNIQICDNLSRDNGWVFSWSMDICQIMDQSCQYQVGIEKVDWEPVIDSETDYPDGIYHGLVIHRKEDNPMAGYISTTDTAGDFDVKISLLDEFGCVWDTKTHINSVFTPNPKLGDDLEICSNDNLTLNTNDPHTDRSNFSYRWNRVADNTPSISLPAGNSDMQFVVEVENNQNNLRCTGRDTVNIKVHPSPIINFETEGFPNEGCEPYTLNIKNHTRHGEKYRWDFGDGTYSPQAQPSHIYAAGTYDVTVYAESEHGCIESFTQEKMVQVFPSPKPNFSWEPAVPRTSNPTVQLINNTPSPENYIYRWEMQYCQSNPYSFHTLTETNPTFQWTSDGSETIAGNYTARLIARSEHYGLSGQLWTCSDTSETKIKIVNDKLEFSNLVTPNGDGFNDRFVIKNLIEGGAYPMNELEIFNSIGVRIYHVENIQHDSQFWDPQVKNSPAGTYYYHFKGRGPIGNLEHKGVIEVMK